MNFLAFSPDLATVVSVFTDPIWWDVDDGVWKQMLVFLRIKIREQFVPGPGTFQPNPRTFWSSFHVVIPTKTGSFCSLVRGPCLGSSAPSERECPRSKMVRNVRGKML